jgi:hypothetical protein
MDDVQTKKLASMLDSYQVADADDALITNILAQVQATPQLTPLPIYVMVWSRYAKRIVMTLCAISGFIIGGLLPAEEAVWQEASNHVIASEADSQPTRALDHMILGPQVLEEFRL